MGRERGNGQCRWEPHVIATDKEVIPRSGIAMPAFNASLAARYDVLIKILVAFKHTSTDIEHCQFN